MTVLTKSGWSWGPRGLDRYRGARLMDCTNAERESIACSIWLMGSSRLEPSPRKMVLVTSLIFSTWSTFWWFIGVLFNRGNQIAPLRIISDLILGPPFPESAWDFTGAFS